MSASFHTLISGAGLGAGAPAAADNGDDRERAADAWALAIAQTLAEGVRPRPVLSLPEESPAAGGAAAPGLNADADAAAADDGVAAGSESATNPARPGPKLPNRLVTELSDSRLGRIELSVARGPSGLHIVISVADSHVKALIEAEQALLLKSLQGCGLRIDSVKIGSKPETGTALAPHQAAQEGALVRSKGNPNLRAGSARRRGYGASTDEEPGEDAERVDLTA